MANFYGSLMSKKNKAPRTITGAVDIHAHIRGYNLGVEVIGKKDDEGNDFFEIWTTGGSNDPKGKTKIATVVKPTKPDITFMPDATMPFDMKSTLLDK